MTIELSELLIPAWQSGPRIMGIVTEVVQPVLDKSLSALDRFELMQDIDEAEGVWLEHIGTRLGLPRPSTSDPATDNRFGFTGPTQARGFDQVPFRGDAVNDALYPLPDAVYRRFLKARAILLLGDGTFQTYVRAVRMIDPGATVRDNRDMSVRVLSDNPLPLQQADSIGALPRNAGVQVTYASRTRFGLSDDPDSDTVSGTGFDQAPFGTD